MGDRRRNVELGPAKLVAKRMWRLPVKRRFQVSLRMSAPAANVPALEEDGDPSDDGEILPHHRVLTELSSGSDSDASDRDEENVALGYLADSEMETRRQRVPRTPPPRKWKANIVHC